MSYKLKTRDKKQSSTYKPEYPMELKLNPITSNQKRYAKAIEDKAIIFGTGIAGSGKTFIAVGKACQALENRDIENILVTRPVIECGRNLGALPGELEDKFAPYMHPFRQHFNHFLHGKFETYKRCGKIKAVPLEFMRGSTFSNKYVLLDEAQNTTIKQMKMFLTRIGENCKLIITGDTEQSDLNEPNGLEHITLLLDNRTDPDIGVILFEEKDCVRSKMARKVLQIYREEG